MGWDHLPLWSVWGCLTGPKHWPIVDTIGHAQWSTQCLIRQGQSIHTVTPPTYVSYIIIWCLVLCNCCASVHEVNMFILLGHCVCVCGLVVVCCLVTVLHTSCWLNSESWKEEREGETLLLYPSAQYLCTLWCFIPKEVYTYVCMWV